MLRNGTLTSVGALLLWIGGCPKRQGPANVVVYVPAGAPVAAPQATKSEVLVIEEPAPPPPPEATPPAHTPVPSARRRPRATAHTETQTETEESATPETPETPPAQVPALEPRESSAQEAALREQVQRLQENVRQRMARLKPAQLSPNEQKTFEDAGTFLAQSVRAFESGDFPRALNLARKASLLVAALE